MKEMIIVHCKNKEICWLAITPRWCSYIRSQFSQQRVWLDFAIPGVALYESFSTFSSCDSQRLQHNLVFLPPAPRSRGATLGELHKRIACRFAWCSGWMLLLSIFLLHFFHSCFCCSLGLGIRLTHKAPSANQRLQTRSFEAESDWSYHVFNLIYRYNI